MGPILFKMEQASYLGLVVKSTSLPLSFRKEGNPNNICTGFGDSLVQAAVTSFPSSNPNVYSEYCNRIVLGYTNTGPGDKVPNTLVQQDPSRGQVEQCSDSRKKFPQTMYKH